MSLEAEFGWRKRVGMLGHKTLLGTYYTASCLRKKVCHFLQQFGLTDAQFNLMMIVKHQSNSSGLSQAQLSNMMLVNPANITALVDRLKKLTLLSVQRCHPIEDAT